MVCAASSGLSLTVSITTSASVGVWHGFRSELPLAVAVGADEAFALEVQKDGLRRFLGAQFDGVNHDFGIGGRLVRIRDASEFLDDAGASLGVQALAVALFTNFERGGCVHQYKPSERFNHLPHRFTRRFIGRNRSANGD